jgi:hypothetical protein
MYFYIASLQRNNKRKSIPHSQLSYSNYINPEILSRQETLIRKGLTRLIEESKQNSLRKKITSQNNQLNLIDYESYSENLENESSDDNILSEEMSVDEILENLFMKENIMNNNKDYKRRLIISKLEEFKYKYVNKHLNRIEKQCAICLEDFKDFDRVKLFSCRQHIFHKECIMKWLNNKDICPLCKQKIVY